MDEHLAMDFGHCSIRATSFTPLNLDGIGFWSLGPIQFDLARFDHSDTSKIEELTVPRFFIGLFRNRLNANVVTSGDEIGYRNNDSLEAGDHIGNFIAEIDVGFVIFCVECMRQTNRIDIDNLDSLRVDGNRIGKNTLFVYGRADAILGRTVDPTGIAVRTSGETRDDIFDDATKIGSLFDEAHFQPHL